MGLLMRKVNDATTIVQRLIRLRKDADLRKAEKRVVLCGTHLVKDVLDNSHARPHHLYLTEKGPNAWSRWLQQTHMKRITTSIIPEAALRKASGLETISEDFMIAELELPTNANFRDFKRILILDGISDPTNAGVLVRTAGALGWGGVIATNNTVDLFNDKAIRAAQSATFLTKVAQLSWSETEEIIEKSSVLCVGADARAPNVYPFLKELKDKSKRAPVPLALILGNEARGLSSEAEKQTYAKVSIPMAPNFDSLNVSVAGGILMQLLRADL